MDTCGPRPSHCVSLIASPTYLVNISQGYQDYQHYQTTNLQIYTPLKTNISSSVLTKLNYFRLITILRIITTTEVFIMELLLSAVVVVVEESVVVVVEGPVVVVVEGPVVVVVEGPVVVVVDGPVVVVVDGPVVVVVVGPVVVEGPVVVVVVGTAVEVEVRIVVVVVEGVVVVVVVALVELSWATAATITRERISTDFMVGVWTPDILFVLEDKI